MDQQLAGQPLPPDKIEAIRAAYKPCCECGRTPLLKTIAGHFGIPVNRVFRILNGRRR